MTAEERVASLHTRMQAYSRKLERRRTIMLGVSCTVLTASLLTMIIGKGAEAGENVLVPAAAAAILAGGVVAAVLLKQQTEKQRETSYTESKRGNAFISDDDLFAVAGGQEDEKKPAETQNRKQ